MADTVTYDAPCGTIEIRQIRPKEVLEILDLSSELLHWKPDVQYFPDINKCNPKAQYVAVTKEGKIVGKYSLIH